MKRRPGQGWGRGAWTGVGLTALVASLGLPYLLVQVGNLGLIREGRRTRREVALTFDDGPDPVTTPAVLDALAAADERATFFVQADRAEAHPELIARMVQEGHQVEAHGEQHRHAWARTPWGAYLDPVRSAARLRAVSPAPVTLHRPPHGAYTLATVLGQRRAGVVGAHWGIAGHEWSARRTPAQVRAHLERHLVAGAVIVLHDAGPGARITAPLLPELLADLRARGYRSVPLRDLGGAQPQNAASLKRRAALALDALYDRASGGGYVAGRADSLFRVTPVRFPLPDLRLSRSEVVRRGTPALEFHANNPSLVDLPLKAWVTQARRQDFPLIARQWQTDPAWQSAELIFCLSSVSPLLSLLKMDHHDVPPSSARRLRLWANVLRLAYGNVPNAKAPRLSVLSRDQFMALYGPAAPQTPPEDR